MRSLCLSLLLAAWIATSGTAMGISNAVADGGGGGSDGLAAQSAVALPAGDFTFMWWVNWKAAIGSGGFGIVFDLEEASGNYVQIGQNSGHGYMELWDGGSAGTDEGANAITNNKWWHYVLRRTGNVFTLHVSDEGAATLDLAADATLTLAMADSWLTIGLQGADDRVAQFKGWTESLTDAQVRIERDRSSACKTSNLWINTKLPTAADVSDSSGNGHNWSINGTIATFAGPSIPETACPGVVTPPVLPVAGSQIDTSTPCCGSHAGGTSTGPIGIPIAPFVNKRSPGGGIVPTAADVVEAEDWADEFPPKEPDIIVTIKGLESIGEEDEHWGFKPMSDRGRHVAARLVEISSIERASTDKDGRFTPARARIVALDDDGTMRERLGDEDRRELTNREALIDLYSYAGRKAGLAGFPLMQGRIVDVQPMLDRKSLIEIQDVVGAQCGLLDPQKLIGLVVGDEHPGKPEESKGRIYNVLLGESTDSGRRDATGASASVGTMPVVDCGDEFISGTPDPEGRTFNDALTAVDDAADVNLTGTGGTIDYPTRVFVAPIIGGEIGPFSDVPTGFLDPDGDGAGNPSVPHAHRKVWMDIAGGADEYLTVFTKVPGFHPVTNATVDLNARYQVVSGTPSMPAFPPRNGGIGPQWDFFVDYLDDADGSQWGVQTVGPPTNLVATVIGTPGTARKSYSVASVSIFGESAPCTPVLVTTAPDVLSATDYVHLTWGPPVDNAASVIGYRVLMTEAA